MQEKILTGLFLMAATFALPSLVAAQFVSFADTIATESINYSIYNNAPPAYQSLEKIAKSTYFIRTVAKFQKEDGTIEQSAREGMGIAIGQGIILTLDHVASIDMLVWKTPFGDLIEPAEKIAESYAINGEEVEIKKIFRDAGEDVALLKVAGMDLHYFPYAFGDSNDLRAGNFLYLFGRAPFSKNLNIRDGIVSAVDGADELALVADNPKRFFMISNGVNQGDSGGPVIAIKNGRFELVGLAHGTYIGVARRVGWALKINFILEKIAPVLKANGGKALLALWEDKKSKR